MSDYMLSYDVRSDIGAFDRKFLAQTPDPQYADPQAYLESLTDIAYGIKNTPFTAKYAPAGWSPFKAALTVWNQAIEYMKGVAVNPGDPNTNNVFDAWVAKTGYLYGGHPLIPVAPSNTGDNVNTATGQDAAPAGTIL